MYSQTDYTYTLGNKTRNRFLFVSKIKKALQTFSFTFAGHSKVPIKNAISSGEFSRSSSLFQMLFDDFDVSLIISLVEFFNHDSDTLGILQVHLLPSVNVVAVYGYIYLHYTYI